MTTKKKQKIRTNLQFKGYNIIATALGNGIAYGLNRAYKHTDAPDRDYIAEQLYNALTNELSDVLDFGDNYD